MTVDRDLPQRQGRRRAAAILAAWLQLDDFEQRVFLDFALRQITAGMPLPIFVSAMRDARDWATFASPLELSAYVAAGFEAMSDRRKADFLNHVQRRAAA